MNWARLSAFSLAWFAIALASSACASEPNTDARTVNEPSASEHPLQWTIRYAVAHQDYIQRSIHDYSCRLVKRERIDGKLQEYQFARLKVRCEQRRDGEIAKPLAVFMQYLAPSRIRDRRILYVDNENNGRALVRKGGTMMRHLKISVDPHGRSARRESNYPITDVGFDKMIQRLIQSVKDDMKLDPAGTNTEVTHFTNAKINGRLCTHIRVVHPRRDGGMRFHVASLYVDDELHVPTRLLVYGWPETEGDSPPLNEEYTYVDLKLNVGLTDADFSESKLGTGAPDERSVATQ